MGKTLENGGRTSFIVVEPYFFNKMKDIHFHDN